MSPEPTPSPSPTPPSSLQTGIALCLSGGGYRAMVFHLGCLWRLNQAGLLSQLKHVSSVSGGSITAGTLALAWNRLAADGWSEASFKKQVLEPVRNLASDTIDVSAVLMGLLLPGSISDRVAAAYRKHLFGDKTLQDMPDAPRFVLNATNVQTGSLWRFTKPYMGDWQIGRVVNPTVSLAEAVACSSAFPPILSPHTLDLRKMRVESWPPDPSSTAPVVPVQDLNKPPFNQTAVLSDGGVYDNLGLESAKRWETLLVSDGGGKMEPEGDPHHDWARHSIRVLNIIDNQVRSLRKRQLIQSYQTTGPDRHKGTYWGIRTNILNYGLSNSLACPFDQTIDLADTATRLCRMEDRLQERLINWGYAVCDAALRAHVNDQLPVGAFPYPNGVAP